VEVPDLLGKWQTAAENAQVVTFKAKNVWKKLREDAVSPSVLVADPGAIERATEAACLRLFCVRLCTAVYTVHACRYHAACGCLGGCFADWHA